MIDARDERAREWYEAHGARRLRDAPLTLVLPLESVRRALAALE